MSDNRLIHFGSPQGSQYYEEPPVEEPPTAVPTPTPVPPEPGDDDKEYAEDE